MGVEVVHVGRDGLFDTAEPAHFVDFARWPLCRHKPATGSKAPRAEEVVPEPGEARAAPAGFDRSLYQGQVDRDHVDPTQQLSRHGKRWAFRRYPVFRRQCGKLAAAGGVQRIGEDVAAYGHHCAALCADSRVLVLDGPDQKGKECRFALVNVDDGGEVGHGRCRRSDEQIGEDGRGHAHDRQTDDDPAALEHCGDVVNPAHESAAVADCPHVESHRRSGRHRAARR